MVAVDALPAVRTDADAFDLSTIGATAHVLCSTDGEKLLLGDGPRRVRLDVRTGTLLDGPVRFHYRIDGFVDLGHKLLTLRRLTGLRRLGHLPATLFAPDRCAERWIALLRTADALAEGASHREIAEGLFGPGKVRVDWRSRSDYLRLRVQRLARNANRLVAGGYLALLQERAPL